jgi:hypothetical protein
MSECLSWLDSITLLATKFRRRPRRPVRWSSSGSNTFPLGWAPEYINYINYGVHAVIESLRDGGGVPNSTCLYTWWKHESLHYVTTALARAKVDLRQIWERDAQTYWILQHKHGSERQMAIDVTSPPCKLPSCRSRQCNVVAKLP